MKQKHTEKKYDLIYIQWIMWYNFIYVNKTTCVNKTSLTYVVLITDMDFYFMTLLKYIIIFVHLTSIPFLTVNFICNLDL